MRKRRRMKKGADGEWIIPAIETEYGGCRFRSRLEARWAVYMDTLGMPWEYERESYDLKGSAELIGEFPAEDLGWYLPDFYLPETDGWVEIKPKLPSAHWELTLPEVKIWNVVRLAESRRGWVFFGPPDPETPVSSVCSFPGDGYPDEPKRFTGLADFGWSREAFEAARSATFGSVHRRVIR